MTRLCAWCCRVLGEIAPLEDASVTHGLCPECHAKMLALPPWTTADALHEAAESGIVTVEVES